MLWKQPNNLDNQVLLKFQSIKPLSDGEAKESPTFY